MIDVQKLLIPFGSIYSLVVDARNTMYDRRALRTYSLGARTISIGNLTTGGTGKTPLVALVAEILAESNEKVCVLTRGYGRENPKARVLVSDSQKVLVDVRIGGDEPVELGRKLIGKALVVADADRVSAAKWAIENFGITAFVLDDGFQHRRAGRDLDIVCIDATNPFGGGRVLPAGALRESLKHLGRADAIVITRADAVYDTGSLSSHLSGIAPGKPIFICETQISSITELSNFHTDSEHPERRLGIEHAYAFCGLGNPGRFFEQLRRSGFEVRATRSFRDHHRYTQKHVQSIEEEAERNGAEVLLTTAKDAVKLIDLDFDMPCFVVETNPVIHGELEFRTLIRNTLKARSVA